MKHKTYEKRSVIKENNNGNRYAEEFQLKVAKEVRDGLIGLRAAAFKYGVTRNSIRSWLNKHSIVTLDKSLDTQMDLPMDEIEANKLLLKRVQDLEKALEKSKLEVSSLKTMIEVAEEELNIKIRKKRGSKQPKECGKSTKDKA